MGWACAVWCLCQTLRDFRCCSLMCSYRMLIALKGQRGFMELWTDEEKLSSHRCSMTSSAEGYSLLATQWNVKRFYLAVSEMYSFSKGCAVLAQSHCSRIKKEKHGRVSRWPHCHFDTTTKSDDQILNSISFNSVIYVAVSWMNVYLLLKLLMRTEPEAGTSDICILASM